MTRKIRVQERATGKIRWIDPAELEGFKAIQQPPPKRPPRTKKPKTIVGLLRPGVFTRSLKERERELRRIDELLGGGR